MNVIAIVNGIGIGKCTEVVVVVVDLVVVVKVAVAAAAATLGAAWKNSKIWNEKWACVIDEWEAEEVEEDEDVIVWTSNNDEEEDNMSMIWIERVHEKACAIA